MDSNRCLMKVVLCMGLLLAVMPTVKPEPIRLCGQDLVRTLGIICRNSFRTSLADPFDGPQMDNDGRFGSMGSDMVGSLETEGLWGPNPRFRGSVDPMLAYSEYYFENDVVTRCCHRQCNLDTLLQYCTKKYI